MMVRTPPLSKSEEEVVMQTHDNVAAQATSSATVAQGDTVSTNDTVNTSPLATLSESNDPQSKIITPLSTQVRGRDDQASSSVTASAAEPRAPRQ